MVLYPVKHAAPPRPSRDDFLARPGSYGKTKYNPEGRHLAADIAVPLGTRVVAPLPGTVTHAGPFGALGNAVALADSRYGYEWWFGHLDSVKIAKGKQARAGKLLGEVGETGNAFGAHLHLAIYAEPLSGRSWGSVPFIDPYPFLRMGWAALKED